jgi:glyoxalase family protein
LLLRRIIAGVFAAARKRSAALIDIIESDEKHGHIALGSVHYIAFRAGDENEQLHWREQLIKAGFNVSPVTNRKYFRSNYFREFGGILFEIATYSPGFAVDERPEAFEPMWAEIEKALPPLEAESFLR